MGTPFLRRGIFRLSNRGTSLRLATLAFGAAMGGVLAYWIGGLLDYQGGRDSLGAYTTRLADQRESLEAESGRAMDQIRNDQMVPCSDEDLAFMRSLLIASEHLADEGRIRDGSLLCSGLIGRLATPVALPNADVVSRGRSTWLTSWPVIPSSLHGHFLESNGVFVAINGQTLRDNEEPAPRMATELLYDSLDHRMLRSSGPSVPLSIEEILAGEPVERNGLLYQPQCRVRTVVCTVTAEPIEELQKVRWSVLVVRVLVGASLGALMMAVAILFEFRRQSLESQLRKAIRHGELSVAYQPIVALASERIVGAEALARWIKPDGESVPPEVFVGLAEERGFVDEITELVVHRVIQEMGDVLARSAFRISLNITGQDLCHRNFLPALERAFDEAGIPRSNVGLELTERSTADPDIGTEALARLKAAGYTLYIDDFGTGYSSLAYLHRLAVDAIKVDRAFTQTIGTDSVTASVVPQILDMARKLELGVVVEGIETREQADYFRGACPEANAQGWLYSRPVSADEVRRMIKAQG